MKFPNVCVWCGKDGAAKAFCNGNGPVAKEYFHRRCWQERCRKVRAERIAKREGVKS